MFLHQLRDRGPDARDHENFCGVQHYGGSAKPSCATVKSRVLS